MIDWNTIDTVLLDMDGTLLDLHFDNFFWQEYVPRCYAQQLGISEAEAFPRIKSWIDHHLGTLNWYCLDFWSSELGLDVASLKRRVADRISMRVGALTFLQRLRESRPQVLMVTNAHPQALALKLERTDIAPYFDAITSSHEFGVAKEEPGFWDALRERHPFAPANALLVDDSLRVLHAARDYGIGHLWSILQPDSSLPAREHTEPFPAIDDFDLFLPEVVHDR